MSDVCAGCGDPACKTPILPADSGGQLVPPVFLRELAALTRETPEQRARRHALDERWRREQAERWAALTPAQRMRVRFRLRVVGPLRAKRRALGMRIAGLTEDDIGGDW